MEDICHIPLSQVSQILVGKRAERVLGPEAGDVYQEIVSSGHSKTVALINS